MDDMSTPIENLNNRSNDSEVVNNILSQYNNLDNSDMPSRSTSISEMENTFEKRNLNNEIYDLKTNDETYKQHYQKEVNRVNNGQRQGQGENDSNENDQNEMYEEDEYEEYEVVKLPLWKVILNQIRIPLFIFITILMFFNYSFDKLLVNKIGYFGNKFNECNTFGFLFKTFIVSIISYVLIYFIKF